jgi:hypothetical protein
VWSAHVLAPSDRISCAPTATFRVETQRESGPISVVGLGVASGRAASAVAALLDADSFVALNRLAELSGTAGIRNRMRTKSQSQHRTAAGSRENARQTQSTTIARTLACHDA